MVSRCACCDLPVETCGREASIRAAADHRARRERALDEPGVIAAQFRGYCSTCGTTYGKGEPIQRRGQRFEPVLCCPDLAD